MEWYVSLQVAQDIHTSQQILQQYFVQEGEHRVELGGYPFVNAYANFHLKQVRFYVMYYHATQGLFANTKSFLVPHYPINPSMLKLGLSWNFWD